MTGKLMHAEMRDSAVHYEVGQTFARLSLAPSPSSETRAPSAITMLLWKSSTAKRLSLHSPHPEVPLLSIAIDGRLSTSAPTYQELMQAESEQTKRLFDWLDAV
jgi:hypothetical protein